MRRLRALAYSGAVALAVFVYLALPTLRALYGPVVTLPVYGVVALVAGGLVWVLLADRDSPERTARRADRDTDARPGADEDVDEELARLREDL
jgi:hypothetical protein